MAVAEAGWMEAVEVGRAQLEGRRGVGGSGDGAGGSSGGGVGGGGKGGGGVGGGCNGGAAKVVAAWVEAAPGTGITERAARAAVVRRGR